jgi:tyrosyl-tRNA synthetase
MNKHVLTIDEVLTRGVGDVLPDRKTLSKLMAKRKIRLYQGFDPSAPSLHLGNFVGLMKLRQFQKLGHEVIFLVGDFTGMIGDPTDKLATRKKLTREQVLENSKAWRAQAGKVLDFGGSNPAKIWYNSKWSDPITFKDLIEITSNLTVQQMIERDMFQARIRDQKPIYLHEFLYPVAQGYDSVCMDVDLEIGGSDQLFNMMVGRTLMKSIKGKEKWVLGTKLLVDKDGNKVGKTTGNALFLDSTPDNFYAGVMSFPDEVIYLGFELLTEIDLVDLNEAIKSDPMGEKKHLAHEIVMFLWGKEAADHAEKNFENTFQARNISQNAEIVEIKFQTTITDLLVSTGNSKSSAKRLLSQNAVDVNGTVIVDPKFGLLGKEYIRVGKKQFYQTRLKK